MQGKVEISGVNTARLQVLSNKETLDLLRKSKAGDQAAREKLISGNLRLVLSVIQKFAGRGENPDDLFQVGCVGLIKAIDGFDLSQPVRFSTYGVPMIAGEIRRYLRDNSAIRVSRSVRDTAYRVLQCKEQLQLSLGREPTLDEIAKQLELPRTEVVGALDAIAAPVSLYEPVYADGGDPLMVMDQLRDTRIPTSTGWSESPCGTPWASWAAGRRRFSPSASGRARPRWRWPSRLASPRPRCPGWRKTPWAPSAGPSVLNGRRGA